MKRHDVFDLADWSRRLAGLMALLLCVSVVAFPHGSTKARSRFSRGGCVAHDQPLAYSAHGQALAPSVGQRSQERRAKAFVLEGVGARNDDRYVSKNKVEVYRDGKKLDLYPGDELREGDRVRSLPGNAETVFSGAFVAIYNDDGEPVLIVGHNRGVDFTLSKLRFDKTFIRAPKVEIINHSSIRPAVEMEIANGDSHGGIIDIFKENGTRERSMTTEERRFLEMQMGLDKPIRREVRWRRASRIITEGRNGAAQEYGSAESDYEEEEHKKLPIGVGAANQEKPQRAKEAEPERGRSAVDARQISAKGCSGFGGKWDTGSYGIMTLNEGGSGSYLWRGETQRISGTVTGNVLEGKFFQPTFPDPRYKSGKVRFTLALDGDSWSGEWWDANGQPAGSWSGTCIGSN